MTASWAGCLLVATPTLLDPHFVRTVVLLLQHDLDGGALGVVLTRPSETAVSEVLPAWGEVAAAPAVVCAGGPVQPTAAVCLGRLRAPVEREGWAPLTDPLLGTVDLDLAPWAGLACVRVFAGYSGWSPGQLEGEVEDGAWFVLPALPDDAFTPSPELLWEQVLRRQGPPLAYAATFPPDPSLN